MGLSVFNGRRGGVGVFTRVDTTGLAAGDYDLKDQLIGSGEPFQ